MVSTKEEQGLRQGEGGQIKRSKLLPVIHVAFWKKKKRGWYGRLRIARREIERSQVCANAARSSRGSFATVPPSTVSGDRIRAPYPNLCEHLCAGLPRERGEEHLRVRESENCIPGIRAACTIFHRPVKYRGTPISRELAEEGVSLTHPPSSSTSQDELGCRLLWPD